MAASAATTVMSGCDTVLASPVAQVMIHQPATGTGYVNNDGARELVNFLDSIKASIINGYVVKAAGKTPRARFEELVDDSTWMPVQDAIDLGLVDGMLDTDEETAQRIAAAGGLLITNMATLSTPPQALLERYEAAVRAGNAEEVPGHPVEPKTPDAATTPATAPENVVDTDVGNNWQLQAAIDLERARCAL
jgi:enoyl-CoA hydratase/carnithine racemase